MEEGKVSMSGEREKREATETKEELRKWSEKRKGKQKHRNGE